MLELTAITREQKGRHMALTERKLKLQSLCFWHRNQSLWMRWKLKPHFFFKNCTLSSISAGGEPVCASFTQHYGGVSPPYLCLQRTLTGCFTPSYNDGDRQSVPDPRMSSEGAGLICERSHGVSECGYGVWGLWIDTSQFIRAGGKDVLVSMFVHYKIKDVFWRDVEKT